MGKTIHICNAFFEWEIAGKLGKGLTAAFNAHPVFRKFLSLARYYAKDGEIVFDLNEETPQGKIESFAPSLLIKEWADKKGLEYAIPDWEVLKALSSKKFAFDRFPLPGAKFLETPEKMPEHFVYKTLHETAGRGHFFKLPDSALFPLIAEPWVERVLDFSSQWLITKDREIILLGLTSCQTDHRGRHNSNRYPAKIFDDGAEHLEKVMPMLEEIARLGFFGHLGIDAFYYKHESKTVLHPCVEINPRKTMGWATLAIQQRHFPNEVCTLSFSPKDGFTLTSASGKKIGNDW